MNINVDQEFINELVRSRVHSLVDAKVKYALATQDIKRLVEIAIFDAVRINVTDGAVRNVMDSLDYTAITNILAKSLAESFLDKLSEPDWEG